MQAQRRTSCQRLLLAHRADLRKAGPHHPHHHHDQHHHHPHHDQHHNCGYHVHKLNLISMKMHSLIWYGHSGWKSHSIFFSKAKYLAHLRLSISDLFSNWYQNNAASEYISTLRYISLQQDRFISANILRYLTFAGLVSQGKERLRVNSMWQNLLNLNFLHLLALFTYWGRPSVVSVCKSEVDLEFLPKMSWCRRCGRCSGFQLTPPQLHQCCRCYRTNSMFGLCISYWPPSHILEKYHCHICWGCIYWV